MAVNHQGVVKVSGVPFNGTGFFKFGLVNDAGNWVWTNDGTRLGTAASTAPVDAVTVGVTNGNYSVRLGDATLTNMVAIPATVFNDNDVKLRVFFNDGVNGEMALSPDQKVTAVPYAFHAHTADTVPGYIDGGVLSNDETDPTNSLHITGLICRDDQNIANIQVPAMSKRVDANWAAGDGNGGLDAGTIGTSQVLVYVYAIVDSTGQNPDDILFSKTGLTPGLPSGYDVKRFIGARLWDGAAWHSFLTQGQGRSKMVWHTGFALPYVVFEGRSTDWADVDVSSLVPKGFVSRLAVRCYLRAENDYTTDGLLAHIRPKDSAYAQSTPYSRVLGSQNTQSATSFSTPVSDEAALEYKTLDPDAPLTLQLRGYCEEL